MRRPVAISLCTVMLLLAACGGRDPSGTTSPVAQATSTLPSSPTATARSSASREPEATPGSQAVDALDELAGAVFQVEQTGEFTYPDGRVRAAGGGSGFIIDPSGLAVTNSHVAASQRSLRVWLGSDRVEHMAEVVGVSECSDIAVIRIDGGPFPYLRWYEGPIRPGLDIYAAGFPLGDPEFTLLGGIVSRARGVIDETWASVEQPIEHDASTNGGNSGGPIVTKQGEVVAVHYASNRETRQAFAISRDEVLALVPDLVAGRDIGSLGVSAEAQSVDVDGRPVPGVVVGAVRAGTAAERAGILPGDVIIEIDGAPLREVDTMGQYCTALRGHGPDDVVDVAVWRSESQQTLRAQINGDPIEPGFSFLATLRSQVPDASSDAGFSPTVDGPAELRFETPNDWLDKAPRPWTVAGREIGPGLIASTSVAGFKGGWTTPGAYVAASDVHVGDRTADEWLDADRSRFEPDCTYVGRQSFTRGSYTGAFDLWDDCGGSDSLFLIMLATPETSAFQVYVQFQATSASDLHALDRLFDTLKVSLGG